MLKDKNIFSLLGSNLAVTLIGMITGLILAKYASLGIRGEVGKVLIWVTFGINLLTLGTIEYYYSGGNNKKLVIHKNFNIVVTTLLISVLSLVFYYKGLGKYIYYIIFLVPMNLFSLYKISELNMCGELIKLSFVKVIQPFIYLLIMLFLIVINKVNTDFILWANLASNFFLTLYLILKARPDVKEINNIAFDKEWLLVSFSTILGVIVSNFDKVYVSYQYNLEEVALYLVGLTLVGSPIGIISQTYASKFIYGKSSNESYYLFLLSYIVMTTLICLIVYFISPFLLNFLFGSKYDGILNILIPLIIFNFLINIRLLLLRLIRNLGRNKEIFKAEIFLLMAIFSIIVLNSFHLFDYIKIFIIIYSFLVFINILYLIILNREVYSK